MSEIPTSLQEVLDGPREGGNASTQLQGLNEPAKLDEEISNQDQEEHQELSENQTGITGGNVDSSQFEQERERNIDTSQAVQNLDNNGNNRSETQSPDRPRNQYQDVQESTTVEQHAPAPSRQDANSIRASQVSLPPSIWSSIGASDAPNNKEQNPGESLDQLTLHPENLMFPNPTTEEMRPEEVLDEEAAPEDATAEAVQWGEFHSSKKKKKKTSAPEVVSYRFNINQLNSHFPNFRNIATTGTRHNWTRTSERSPRIVFFDRFEPPSDQAPVRHEPWKDRTSAPVYRNFAKILKTVPRDCDQRIVLVEDLTPALIDLLGATFQIPPHVFEEHLDRSGFRKTEDTGDNLATWYTRSSAQGYASVMWYRPVRPIIPVSKLRKKLISDSVPIVRCPFEGCRPHSLELSTLTNIWRRNLKLSPDQEMRQKEGYDPVGWEEKATIWTREFDGCKFGKMSIHPP